MALGRNDRGQPALSSRRTRTTRKRFEHARNAHRARTARRRRHAPDPVRTAATRGVGNVVIGAAYLSQSRSRRRPRRERPCPRIPRRPHRARHSVPRRARRRLPLRTRAKVPVRVQVRMRRVQPGKSEARPRAPARSPARARRRSTSTRASGGQMPQMQFDNVICICRPRRLRFYWHE